MRTQTTRISIDDLKIKDVLVSGEFEIAVWTQYWPEEREMGYVREPAHLEIEAYEDGSYADDNIYLYDEEGEEVELDFEKDRVLFAMAERLIIEHLVDNCHELIEERVHEEAADQAEAAAMAGYDY